MSAHPAHIAPPLSQGEPLVSPVLRTSRTGGEVDEAQMLDVALRQGSEALKAHLRAALTLSALRGDPALRDVVSDDIGRILRQADAARIQTLTSAGYRPDVAELFAEKLAAAQPRPHPEERGARPEGRYNSAALFCAAMICLALAHAAHWSLT